jgi:hypothetical protein
MELSREEKKAKLMARLEKAVDELMEWEEEHKRPTLTQIEDIVCAKKWGKRWQRRSW